MKELILALLLLAGTGGVAMVVTGHGDELKEAISGAVSTDIRSAAEDVRSHIPSGKPEPPGLAAAGEPSDTEPAHATTMTIGHTDGVGVSLRSGCADDERIDGSLPDGTAVSVTERGSGPCANWSLVATDTLTTWVRNRYLLASPAADPDKNDSGSGDSPKPDKLRGESNDDHSADEPGGDDADDESDDHESDDDDDESKDDEREDKSDDRSDGARRNEGRGTSP